jgi:multiple sugar transport system substrate-binding protein
MIELTGVSWDHTRGHDPMVATAQSFMETCPDLRITWSTRSLQDFADYPIEKLAERYDLILIDHPFAGFAARDRCLLALDEVLAPGILDDQGANSVGRSSESYHYGGHQWALAIDAASQVSAYRSDLLEQIGASVPRSWDEVVALARSRKGQERAQVAIPLIPVDTIMSFLSICANLGEPAFTGSDVAVGRTTGRAALELLTELCDLCHPQSLQSNPIKTFDRMSETDEVAYVPLAFGYSNYARDGFRRHLISFTNIPLASDGAPRGAILGGVGLAISARTSQPEVAARYAAFVASGEIQRTLFFESGGQPAHRTAWLDDHVNEVTHGFFANTLDTLDHCYLRPRYHGFMEVQDRASILLHEAVRESGDIDRTLDELDRIYRSSLQD